MFHLLVVHLYRGLELLGRLGNVYVRDILCEEPIEQLYYTAKFPLICMHCAHSFDAVGNLDSDYFPQCVGCKDKPKIMMYFYRPKK